MQRQRDGLVPIGEALADLPGPVRALRKTSPPARRGFTLADQVTQLVGASEADPDLGFMARMMALCSLPGCVATFKRRQESDGSGRPGAVSCSHPEHPNRSPASPAPSGSCAWPRILGSFAAPRGIHESPAWPSLVV